MILIFLCAIPFFIRAHVAKKISLLASLQDVFLNVQLLTLFWIFPKPWLFAALVTLSQLYLLADAFLYKETDIQMQLSFYSYLKEARTLLSSAKKLPWKNFLLYLFLIALANSALLFVDQRFSMPLLCVGMVSGLIAFLIPSKESNALVREEIRGLKTLCSPLFPTISGYPLWKWTGNFEGEKLFHIRIESEEKPHLIVVFMESFRKLETPHFNALCKEGVFFPRFYANHIQSNHAIIASFFGILPELGKATMFTDFRFGLKGLPELMQENGYQTAYFHNGDLNFESQKSFLKAHGFEHLFERKDLSKAFPKASYTSWGLHDEYLMPYAADWLEKQKKPSFLTLFTMSNHHPWEVPAHYSGPPFPHPYLQTLHYSDTALGHLIQTLKKKELAKKSLIVILGDHGQSLREHPIRSVYEESVHVPLLILGEGRLKPQTIEELGSQMDLLPTLMDILSLEGFTHSAGKSLMRRDTHRRVLLQNFHGGGHLGWREENHKYILNLKSQQQELYDLKHDPKEHCNLADQHPDLLTTYKARVLKEWEFFQALYKQKKLNPFATKNAPYKIEFSEDLDDKKLIQSTQQKGCLTHLHLQQCLRITDYGLTAIAPKCHNLEVLDLKGCLLLTQASVHAILERARDLYELHLRDVDPIDTSLLPQELGKLLGCTTDDFGIEMLAQRCPKLSVLKIDAHKLTDKSLSILGASCKFLRTLHIQKAFNITDHGLRSFIQNQPQITHILIEDAPHITDAGLQDLKTSSIKLLYCTHCPQVTEKCFEGLDLQFYSLTNTSTHLVGSKFIDDPTFQI